MGNELKTESRKQYLKYFRVWFLIVGALLVISVVMVVKNSMENKRTRTNLDAPAERVYDYADVLTDEQEDSLRDYIAKAEKKYKIDIVLLTTNQPMEGAAAMEAYGYRSTDWEQNMMDVADDFWDKNKYGFNKGFEGDGALLLSNWYEGQAGEHLSTSGRVEYAFSVSDIDSLLNRVGFYIEGNPYKAYIAYVDALCNEIGGVGLNMAELPIIFLMALPIPTVVALIYMFVHMYQKKAKDTTTANTYVAGGRPVLKNKSDQFIRKHVTSRRIETSSSSGGGSRSSGGGGHHRSRSGASHGGGSRRR